MDEASRRASVSSDVGRAHATLHVVTDDRTLAREGWPAAAADVLRAGGPALALHVRGPRTAGRRIFDLARPLLDPARTSGAELFVNDRVDVALALGVHGVQLGRRSLPVPAARALLGGDIRIGVSVHDADEAERAALDGPDHLFVGTIYPTPSHEGLPGMGPNGLRVAAQRAGDVPVVAIGGIEEGRVADVMEAGASGVAVLRAVWDAVDPVLATTGLLEAIEGAIDG